MNHLISKSGDAVPPIGLGTYPLQGREMADVVKVAVNIGYRLFDTSDDYRGESGIGLAFSELIESGQINREKLFLQTKISDNNAYSDEPLKGVYFNPNSRLMQRHSVEEIVREKVASSLRVLSTDYLDSLLIHYPFPGYFVDVWRVMIDLRTEGIVRYIGVSNFHERHIEQLISITGVNPDINEVYMSPLGIKQSLVDYCSKHNCMMMTYSPLMDVAAKRIPSDKIQPLAEKYRKSIAQIILRWSIDRGSIPLPKTKHPKRLKENFDVLDFSLTSEEISVISSLNNDFQYIVESKTCPGL